MKRLKPDVVFSKGGFVSVPVVYGARLHKVPVLLHESDMTPGLANKLCAPFARRILCTFPEAARSFGDKGVHTGTPIRPEILQGSREKGLATFGFTNGRPVLMVTGGSSGAQAINAVVREALPRLLESFQVLHLCGPGNADEGLLGTAGYVQCEYLNSEMADAYACANILISRAGSNTLCEILALRKPALLIPYPKGASRGDQIVNARSFEARGLSRVLMQEDMTVDRLVTEVISLYRERGSLYEKMDQERPPRRGKRAAGDRPHRRRLKRARPESRRAKALKTTSNGQCARAAGKLPSLCAGGFVLRAHFVGMSRPAPNIMGHGGAADAKGDPVTLSVAVRWRLWE